MIKRLLIAVAMLCAVSGAQTPVTPISQPRVNFVNAIGGPCVGCSLYTYVAGTTTLKATYTDSTGTSMNTNPIILDASGGAFIWVGRSAYKFILKDTLGATIWSVDNVNEGNLFPCGPSGTVQIANLSVSGMDCDTAIYVNKSNHTLNVGTVGASHVVIGPLGTPTLWTFDTTTPATALASLGGSVGGLVNSGTINQIGYYAAAGNTISGTSAIPSSITATTQSPDDNSTKIATTGYVKTPGAINPSGVQVASGASMTGNQGNGTKVQHATGTTTTDNLVKFDSAGNVVDSGIPAGSVTSRTCNANGCYRIEGDGTIEQWGISSVVPAGADTNTVTVTFPISFTTTTNLSFTAMADDCANTCSGKNPIAVSGAGSLTTSSIVVSFTGVVPTGGGGSVLVNPVHAYWHAIGN